MESAGLPPPQDQGVNYKFPFSICVCCMTFTDCADEAESVY